jgi:hypothetical protein
MADTVMPANLGSTKSRVINEVSHYTSKMNMKAKQYQITPCKRNKYVKP